MQLAPWSKRVAGGFAKDGAVQDQIDATIEDAVNRARDRLPRGESLKNCEKCDTTIPANSQLQRLQPTRKQGQPAQVK
jgi:RNA polymerase-binding transcription factor DksA